LSIRYLSCARGLSLPRTAAAAVVFSRRVPAAVAQRAWARGVASRAVTPTALSQGPWAQAARARAVASKAVAPAAVPQGARSQGARAWVEAAKMVAHQQPMAARVCQERPRRTASFVDRISPRAASWPAPRSTAPSTRSPRRALKSVPAPHAANANGKSATSTSGDRRCCPYGVEPPVRTCSRSGLATWRIRVSRLVPCPAIASWSAARSTANVASRLAVAVAPPMPRPITPRPQRLSKSSTASVVPRDSTPAIVDQVTPNV
jgi:hypothetical protein